MAHWFVPFTRNEVFVGRVEDLQRLHAALDAHTQAGIRPAGVTGLGGIGKTQLAVEYAFKHQADYPDGTFWINAAADWRAEFAEVGKYLDRTVAGQPQDVQIRAAADYLAAHPNSLLIFDNVQDPQKLRLPLTPYLIFADLPCRLLFTTRRHDLGGFNPVELNVLPLEPGLKLLLRHPSRQEALATDHPEHAAAVAIYKMLGGLPLALEIAGAHLGKKPQLSVGAYRDELLHRGALAVVDDPRGGVREIELGTRHAAAIAATLAEQWAGLSADARWLLRVAAELPEAAAIPLARLGLLAGLPEEGESFFDAALPDAARELFDASLLQDLAGDLVRLHPLVREFAAQQKEADDERVDLGWLCGARLIAAYADPVLLERHCAGRGVDAVEQDILAALDLLGGEPVNEAQPSVVRGVRQTATQLLRAVRLESHTLRGWNSTTNPLLFRQQWLKRTLQLGDTDGSKRASMSLQSAPGPRLEVVWTTAQSVSALVRTLIGHRRGVNTVAVTPDGRYAVSGSYDETLRVWDLMSGECIRTLTGHGGSVGAVIVTADSRHALSGSDDGTLRVWNLADGRCALTLTGHSGPVLAIAVTANGRYAISGSSDHTLRVWDLMRGKCLRSLKGHSGPVLAVAAIADGRSAVSGSSDGTLRMWNLASGKCVRTLTGHLGSVLAVVSAADGRLALSGSSDGTLRVWDLANGKCERTLREHNDRVLAVAVTPDGRHAVSASADGTLLIWDLDSGKYTRSLIGHSDTLRAVVMTPDGHYAVSGSYDGTLRVWDLANNTSVRTLTGHDGEVLAVAVAANKRHVISGSYDGTLRMWDLTDGKSVRSLTAHSGAVWAVTVTADNYHVLSGLDDGTLRLWDLASGECVRTFTGHSREVLAVAMTADSLHALSGSSDHTLRIWDLACGKCMFTLAGHTSPVLAVAITGDGHEALSGSTDWTLRVWDLASGQCLRTLIGHSDSVQAVAVTLDGRYALSGSNDHTLRVWDLVSGECLHTLVGHNGQVYTVAVIPDSRHVVSGSADNTLRVWDLVSGVQQAQLVLEAPVLCVTIAADRRTIVAGDAAGDLWCVRFWE